MNFVAACVLLALTQTMPAAPPVIWIDGQALLGAIHSAPADRTDPAFHPSLLATASGYPVAGVRRTGPGASEMHAAQTDVWYVLQGAATLVTGGTMTDGAEIAPGEIRGRGIAEGATRRIHAGDLVVIPSGVPHWIREVEGGEVLYLLVKVPAAGPRDAGRP